LPYDIYHRLSKCFWSCEKVEIVGTLQNVVNDLNKSACFEILSHQKTTDQLSLSVTQPIFRRGPDTGPYRDSDVSYLSHAQATIKATLNPPVSLWRGFLTSFLNPKGLFVYLSIVPQFINPINNAGFQALVLSVTNAALCYIVYATVGLIFAQTSSIGAISPLRIRIAEAVGGALLGSIAATIAITT
jgi:hypothetical protein